MALILNVWIVNHYALSPDGAGGTRHFYFSRYLSERGCKITIIASSYNHWSKRDEHLEGDEKYCCEENNEVKFLWLRTPPYLTPVGRIWNMLVFAFRLRWNSWSSNIDHPDVIVASSPHLFSCLTAYFLSRRYRIPFVLEIRDLWPQTLVDLGKLSKFHPLVIVLGAIERFLYRKASRIISLLPGAIDHIVQKGGKPDKIMWIPNGVDLTQVPQLKPKSQCGIFSIYYAGSHGLANGLLSIIKAAELLEKKMEIKNICFHLLGDGPDKKKLINYVKKQRINNVIFHDPVPKNQIYKILQDADAFILTLLDSDLYRFGVSLNKLYDYLALAKPIVFGANSINNPVADSDSGYVVAPEAPAAMAEAVASLVAMPPEEREHMGLRGREYVEKNNNIAILSEHFEFVCRSCFKGGRNV